MLAFPNDPETFNMKNSPLQLGFLLPCPTSSRRCICVFENKLRSLHRAFPGANLSSLEVQMAMNQEPPAAHNNHTSYNLHDKILLILDSIFSRTDS